MKPTVSVVMPVFNGEQFVGRAIQSILDQTYSNWELVIVDDCGTDHSMEIVNSFKDERIKIIQNNSNEGIAFSRNRAIENSTGRYIAILDDDDVALPERLKLQINYLEEHPDIGVVGGRAYWIDEENAILRSTAAALMNPKYISALYLFSGVYINCTCTFRRNLFVEDRIRYQDNMQGMEDVLFWIECSKVSSMSNVEEFVSLHREHKGRESNRVIEDGGKARAIKWAQIHDYSLRRSGFELTPTELEIIHIFDPELKINIPAGSKEELYRYYQILKKIIIQAEKMNLENKEEIANVCRKRFSRAIEKSYLWM